MRRVSTRRFSANPREVYLIEGHTDAVGSDVDNLSLSDRRAEAVAQVLTEQFQVPAENLTSQGYGEQYLKVPTDGPERVNRRVTMRRITPLLTGQNQTVAPPPPGIPPPRRRPSAGLNCTVKPAASVLDRGAARAAHRWSHMRLGCWT